MTEPTPIPDSTPPGVPAEGDGELTAPIVSERRRLVLIPADVLLAVTGAGDGAVD